jgi:2-deoxy-D-gluconate 3-dehydrogenase
MKDLFSLQGRTAIVTGGNAGIGKGIARGFAAHGCNVVIAARNAAKNEETVKELQESFGVGALAVGVDVRQESQIREMVANALDAFDKVDILVNNAGMNIRKWPQEYLAAEWDQILEVNLRSAFLCSQAVYPSMKAAGGGKIINIGSMTSILGGGKLAPYGASKGGIVQLARSLAAAWAPDNIQVNAILPGWINTNQTRQARKDIAGLHENVLRRTPAGRWGEPEDLVGAAVFLAGRASDFVTGAALAVDGGLSISLL